MKVLYAIQGTGNGHLSRARDIVPILLRKNIDLDLLVSGTQADMGLPYPVKYQLKGWSFIFGKKGGVDMWRTYLRTNSLRLQKEIRSVPVSLYDLVINDFEPVSAWACKLHHVACTGFSHQSAVLAPNAPKPEKKDMLGKLILKNYAPTSTQFGLHFKNYGDKIYTPVIRQEVRNTTRTSGDYYTVYLPAYSDGKILNVLSQITAVKWEVFSKNTHSELLYGNIKIRPIDNLRFIQSMAGSRGILCGAGFETPAEALYMGKKLMVVPMKGQYEQQCNAAALKEMGVPVIKSLKLKQTGKIQDWVSSAARIDVYYPDITEAIINRILEESAVSQTAQPQ